MLSDCTTRPIVAVIDTGVAIQHPDLAPNIWQNPGETANSAKPGVDDDCNGYVDDKVGWNFLDTNNDVSVNTSHGTHVAGVIAAKGGNTIGVSGICPNAQIMALRAVRRQKFDDAAISKVLAAIYYAIDNRAAVINASWGFDCYDQSNCPPKDLVSAVQEAGKRQILIVTGPGNDARNIDDTGQAFYPASLDEPNVIAVASTDQYDELAAHSAYGCVSVDLAAPGEAIMSTYNSQSNPLSYKTLTGTSYATAMVSGAVLLMLDRFPRLKANDIKAHLLREVDKRAPLERKTVSGGRLNVCRALCVCPQELAPQHCPPCSASVSAACSPGAGH